MAVNGLMAAALSGLQTAQTALTTVSNNIANVNTPGYARKIVEQSSVVGNGAGIGVTVDDIQPRQPTSSSSQANLPGVIPAAKAHPATISNLLDQAQAAFGDPTQATSYLNQLSTVFSDFSAAANDPASTLPRTQVLDDLTDLPELQPDHRRHPLGPQHPG